MSYDDDLEKHNKDLQDVIRNLEDELNNSNKLLYYYICFHFKCLLSFEDIRINDSLHQDWKELLEEEYKNKDLVERIIDPMTVAPELWEEHWSCHHYFREKIDKVSNEEDDDE